VASDRSVRNLGSLKGASTSRVLNLAALRETLRDDEAYKKSPLFESPAMNGAIVIKHRLRADETYLFDTDHRVATKIIIPFDANDLRLGGTSFFYGQRGFADVMRQLDHGNTGSLDRDMEVLKLIASVPSLDPFLLREHLRINQYNVADCYFEISPGDKRRMYEFVSNDVRRLISLATAKSGSGSSSTTKLVSALLSTEVDEKLEPMRLTLGLDGAEFREGVFSWRGFLYYKWSMSDLWPELAAVAKDLKILRAVGAHTHDQLRAIAEGKRRVMLSVIHARQDVAATIATYDNAYNELVEMGKPNAFRDFLLTAPAMFIDLGERIGALSHIVSFWKFRFRQHKNLVADADELLSIFQDFESGFSHAVAEEPQRATGTRGQ
jgi:hypothetical protein